MAINGKLISQWQQGDDICVAVAVDEGAKIGGVIEYNACVPYADLEGKTANQQRAAFLAALKAVRAKQMPTAPPARTVASLPADIDLS